jgi:hypothetical protein
MRFVVPKVTLTYADTLEAIGLAHLLGEITGARYRLLDLEESYAIEGPDLPAASSWPAIEPGYPFIYLPKDGTKPAGWILDYLSEREKDQRRREFFKAAGKKRGQLLRTLREQGQNEPVSPVPEYKMALFLASMRRGWSSDKKLYRWLQTNRQRAMEWIAANLGIAASSQVDAPVLTNSQVFNPVSGKGVHRAKPDSTAPTSISGEVIDPFKEWLKYRGAYQAMLPYRTPGGDFKVFVIAPADIATDRLAQIYHEMRRLNLWEPIRLDIEAPLRLAEYLIRRSDVVGGGIRLAGRRPPDVIRGLHQAFFKSLGTSPALMNYSFMVLPSWFRIIDQEAAKNFVQLIHSFIGYKAIDGVTGCLRSLDESHSDDVLILQQFRQWLASGELRDYLEFSCRFSLHVIKRMSEDEWVKTISTHNLDILMIRGYDMQGIIEVQGFKNVAKAIRNATIYALAAQRQDRRKREVHFGLAQKWKQKIKGGNAAFITALSDFVQQYNWQSEDLDKKQEGNASAGRWKHHKVNAADLDEVIGLVEQKGAELIGMMLLAYGYARVPKTDPAEPDKENITEGA